MPDPKPRSTMNIKERAAFRDSVAVQIAGICVADLSRQISAGAVPINDLPRAIERIAAIGYGVADALLAERDR